MRWGPRRPRWLVPGRRRLRSAPPLGECGPRRRDRTPSYVSALPPNHVPERRGTLFETNQIDPKWRRLVLNAGDGLKVVCLVEPTNGQINVRLGPEGYLVASHRPKQHDAGCAVGVPEILGNPSGGLPCSTAAPLLLAAGLGAPSTHRVPVGGKRVGHSNERAPISAEHQWKKATIFQYVLMHNGPFRVSGPVGLQPHQRNDAHRRSHHQQRHRPAYAGIVAEPVPPRRHHH